MTSTPLIVPQPSIRSMITLQSLTQASLLLQLGVAGVVLWLWSVTRPPPLMELMVQAKAGQGFHAGGGAGSHYGTEAHAYAKCTWS